MKTKLRTQQSGYKTCMSNPRLLITLGDVAGIGPEIVARAWVQLVRDARPIVVGDSGWVERGIKIVGSGARVQLVSSPSEARPAVDLIPCIRASTASLDRVETGRVSAEAGKVTYFEGTPIPSSVLLVLLLVALTKMGRVGTALPGGVWGLGPYDLHPLALLFALSGSLMISKTLHIPKP